MKDHWKGKRTKARMKVATALRKIFKNIIKPQRQGCMLSCVW